MMADLRRSMLTRSILVLRLIVKSLPVWDKTRLGPLYGQSNGAHGSHTT